MAHRCRLKPFSDGISVLYRQRLFIHTITPQKAQRARATSVGTISFVKTKRNRTHDTQMPSETFFRRHLHYCFHAHDYAAKARPALSGPLPAVAPGADHGVGVFIAAEAAVETRQRAGEVAALDIVVVA